MSASLEIASKDYGRGGVGVKKIPQEGKTCRKPAWRSLVGFEESSNRYLFPTPER